MRKKLSSMQYGKTNFAILIISILALTFIYSGVSAFGAQGQGKPQVVAIQGLAKVEGQDAIVEILVAVQPGENAKAKAREKLRRMYPDAVEIGSSNYSLTGLDWKDDSDFQTDSQVPFVYNNSNIPAEVNPDGSTVMRAAFLIWNDVETSIFNFEFDTTSYNGCPSLVKECRGKQSFNGKNEIAWLDIREPSVLGVTWYGTNIEEFDMALDNADFNWYDGIDPNNIPNNAIDLQTVWSHELGHALGLGHSDVNGAVMEPYYAGPRRDLHQDDIDGITFLYPTSDVDLPPSVSITGPADGSTFSSEDSIAFAGTATDDEDGDLTAALSWNSDVDGTLGTGGSFSTLLSNGPHNITATVGDSNEGTGSDSVGITVIVPGEGDQNDIYVWAIDFSEKRKGRGGSLVDLNTIVTIYRDSDASGSAEGTDISVEGANVQMTLTRDGAVFNFSGNTNSEGNVKFTLQHALKNTPYTATVTGVIHSTYNYNNLLNVETQDSHTIK